MTEEDMAEAVVDGLAGRCRLIVGEVLSDGDRGLIFCYDVPRGSRPFTAGHWKAGRVCSKCGASTWEDPNWHEPN